MEFKNYTKLTYIIIITFLNVHTVSTVPAEAVPITG